ncbi:MAG: 16S rRNA (guanine(966)-N(2))-methyltransferase RsmD [Oscillospiraceae bacterium]|nr:16S rRNA (guanine(966)-N(2))-methyltransferase RsmD [Oscillospiraceae bacterium]
MRVITGSARGKHLETLTGVAVRPTSELVKEAIFSIIQFDIEGRRFLDLFAGSGQIGIEALSRGAESATFIDAATESLDIVRRNLKSTGLEKQAVVFKSDYSSYLTNCKSKYDIAFIDPPYAEGKLIDALQKTAPIMSDYGIIICEHPHTTDMPQDVGEFPIKKQYRYGKIMISLYTKQSEK